VEGPITEVDGRVVIRECLADSAAGQHERGLTATEVAQQTEISSTNTPRILKALATGTSLPVAPRLQASGEPYAASADGSAVCSR
jgi:hypothetical protein